MSLSLQRVRKLFGPFAAVDGVSVDIAEGEFFVVLGPSGCGKSTLLRLIAGLERLDDGEISLDARRLSGPDRTVAPEHRGVGVVFQSYALWPHMDVLDNVAFPIESAGASRSEARRMARSHLATVALADLAERRPADLSGGQRQRVALARCLAARSKVVLMDEPLANLDPHLRGAMEDEIAAFHRRSGAATLFITHDQREAMALASRIAVMRHGRFEQVATPRELYERPANEAVARFIGRAAVLDAEFDANGEPTVGGIAFRLSEEAARSEGPAKLVVRPENVRLGDGPFRGRLDRVFYRGGVWEGVVAVPGLSEDLPVRSDRPIATGEAVALEIVRAWVLPASEPPRHDAGRQRTAETVE